MNYEEIWDGCVKYSILQKYNEFIPLLKWIEERLNQRKRCLEIGCRHGGSAYGFSFLFDEVIAIDYVNFPTWEQIERSNIKFLQTDSHYLSVLNFDNFDCIHIDGDHTYEGALQDFELAKQLITDDGIIVLHDILGTTFDICEVDKLWSQIEGFSRAKIVSLKNDPEDKMSMSWMKDYKPSEWGGIGILKKCKT
jgi:hypothetical protein